MEKLSIRLKIADREYPMKVDPEEEEKVRSAGRMINERLKSYREQFGIDDKQDLLAMVAFDSFVEKLKTEKELEYTDNSVQEKVDQLNQLISQAL